MANEFLTKKVVKIPFSISGTDSAGIANTTIATHGTGVFIPKNAIIVNSYYNVTTTFTSATDAATLALSVVSAGDLKAAMAISDATNVWDAGAHGNLPGSYAEATVAGDTAVLDAARKAASFIVMAANKEVTVAVAVEALTAGAMDIFIEYVS
jgi:hypothetical protein